MTPLPPPPALLPMTHIDCEVGALVTLGPARTASGATSRWAAARCAGRN